MASATARTFSRRLAAVAMTVSWLATMAISNSSAKMARLLEALSGGTVMDGSSCCIQSYLLCGSAMKTHAPQAGGITAPRRIAA
jgi:hypothetical protein